MNDVKKNVDKLVQIIIELNAIAFPDKPRMREAILSSTRETHLEIAKEIGGDNGNPAA
jgi:hypothetical protein